MLRVNKTVGIIGLGLLGGSLAMALKAYTDYECVGYARRQEICDQALADGCVSQAWTNVDELITHSDIVVFALPPETNARLFEEKAHLFKTGQIVTDVSSAKDEFAAAVYEHIPDGVSFVSIHPMAGSEKGGYEVASKDLFQKMGWIVLDDPGQEAYDPAVADQLAAMGKTLGSRVERIPLKDHDHCIAAVSHMPHAMASIIATVAGGGTQGEQRMRMSAGGFRDSTRVAGGHPGMWREILMGNRDNVMFWLDEVFKQVGLVKDIFERHDDQALEEYLTKAKGIRDKWPIIMGLEEDKKPPKNKKEIIKK